MNTLPKSALDQLAREQRAAAGVHPDADVMTAFCEGTLTSAERTRVMDHLARCGDCRDVAFLAAPDLLSQPAVPERPAVAGSLKPPLVWWRRFMPAIAAAAAMVVVGSAVLLDQYSSRNSFSSVASGESPKLAAPAAQPTDQSAEYGYSAPKDFAKRELQSKTASPTRSSIPVPSKVAPLQKQEPGVLGGLVGEARPRSAPTVGGPLQTPMAAGPRGAVEPKGAFNYQNLAVTPPRSARVAPGAHGEVEAKGNAYFMDNAVQAAPAYQPAVLPPPPPEQQAPNDQVALRADVSNLTVTGRSATELARVSPEKAKTVDKKAPAAAMPQVASSQGAVVGGAKSLDVSSPEDNFTSDVPVGEQDARQTLIVTKDFKWRIGDHGQLQRSTGKDDWKPTLAKTQTRFHVVSVTGNDVWAGGTSGRLYHSLDGGEHWTRIEINAGGQSLSDTITSIRFRDALNGTVVTDSGAVWETHDGGLHWTRK